MIEIINLSKAFDAHRVLRNLNLTIKKGRTQVIIGRSGCGKSVLLKHIVGLLKPDSGQVFVDGQDITRFNEKELNRSRLKIGMLFQGAALFDSLSVGENVGFTLREHSDLDEPSVVRRVKESLELVGLGRGGIDACGFKRGNEKAGGAGPGDLCPPEYYPI